VKKQKTLSRLLFALSMTLSIGAAPQAPQSASVEEQVSQILVRFPAPGPAEKASLSAEIFRLGEAGIAEICRRLAAPGTADDSLARYALEAAGTYAMRPGGEEDRNIYVHALVEALQSPVDPDVGAFLIGRLGQAGGPECLEPLSRLLADQKLAGPAVRALLALRPPGTERALFQALGRAETPNQVPFLQALGGLRSQTAATGIVPFVWSPDAEVREAALSALAASGDLRTESLLSRIDIASSPRERTAAALRYLLFARRVWENGRREAALRIAEKLLSKSTGVEDSPVRCAALTLFSEINGKDALPRLVEALDSPDPAFRARALELGLGIPGEEAAAQWTAKAPQVSPEARAQIIGMLGRREDGTALAFIKESLRTEEPAVRRAAIEAAARLGGDGILDSLSPLWRTADEEEAAALEKAYLSLAADRSVPDAAGAYASASPPAQAAIIEILGERRARGYAGTVLAAVENRDEKIRQRALAALEAVVSEKDLSRIIHLLKSAGEPSETSLLQNALAAAARQAADREAAAGLIIEAMHRAKGQKRIDLLRPLSRIGGEKALRAVVAETQSADRQVRSIAVYALANWPDDEAVEELLKIARAESSSASRKIFYLALQGYVRLVTESPEAAERKPASMKEAMSLAREPAETNLVLAGLGRVRSRESLGLIAPYLENPDFREKGAQAAVDCALPSPGFGGLAGFETARTLKRAAQFIKVDYDREQVEQYAQTLFIQEGFVPLFNGKDLSGWKGLVEDPPSRSRMSQEALHKEQETADEDMRRHWRVIEGTLVFDGQGHNLCTAGDFADFELLVDWKIEPGGDSGIYLRGSPQVQIWDPGQSPEGSGGLYNNKNGPAQPLRAADNPVGEWNTFFIRMAGDRVSVQLNGAVIVEDGVMENYWEPDKPIYPQGQIELQAHGTPLYFRHIYIRKLS
jgi:HEAT repeat protein